MSRFARGRAGRARSALGFGGSRALELYPRQWITMKQKAKQWITFSLRWGIAVAGIWWVLAKTPFHDQLMLVNPQNAIVRVTVLGEPAEEAARFDVYDPVKRMGATVARDDVWTQPDAPKVNVVLDGRVKTAKLLAIRPGVGFAATHVPAELLVKDPDTGAQVRLPPPDGYHTRVPYPMVDIGIFRLVRHANLLFLLAALMVLPLSYLITSRRWHLLLEALDIHLSQARTFVLNMVGAFYNTFMPGSTGGDLIKAYYAAKHTTHRVRAVLSVIVDRVIGLLALIILGGVMATVQWHVSECRKVAIVCAALIACTITGLVVFYHPTWRRATGLEWMMRRLPMQKQVRHAVEAMELYGRRPSSALAALVMTFPVHMTSVLSAIFAGQAFGLKMSLLYYWTVVPVITLVGAIPISPQGAGVMEAFAVLLTRRQGVTISQAIALTMAIRFGQMFWNLVAGLFVLRGGYHAPSDREQETLEEDGPEGGNDEIRMTKSESNPNGKKRMALQRAAG